MTSQYTGKNGASYRHEPRFMRRVFVEVRPLSTHDLENFEALTTDISESGMGLITDLTLPLGTLVKISFNDQVAAVGEIINIDEWEYYGIARLGVKFLETKENMVWH